jgi:hypothetical protein
MPQRWRTAVRLGRLIESDAHDAAPGLIVARGGIVRWC